MRFYGDALPVEAVWEQARQSWSRQIAGLDLPWYLEARRAEGAQAAFIGIICHADGNWYAIAAGDSCLLHRRGNTLLTIFPLTRADDFPKTPALWATHAQPAQNESAARFINGHWESGDSLYLMSDALALWFLREKEGGEPPWVWLDSILSDKDFRQRVSILRQNGRLRGDDTTLLSLRFDRLLEESTEDSALAHTD